MSTGERLMLSDIFPADSEVWPVLVKAVQDGINVYYPDMTPNAEAYEAACTRAPGGICGPMAKAGLGWPLIQWTSQGTDWDGPDGRDPYKVSGDVVGTADDGGIILMHDMKPNSFRASEMFITRLQEKGYIFLTVDELFVKDGVELLPDTAYWRCTNGVTTDD